METKDLIYQFFSYFGLTQDQIQIDQKDDSLTITLLVPPPDSGRYIGRFATTLDSLQLILSLIINNGQEKHLYIQVDVGGYRAERLTTLESMADRLTQQVESSGVAHEFPPLSAADRRAIHLLFKDNETLTTYSQGEGQDRRLVLAPKA